MYLWFYGRGGGIYMGNFYVKPDLRIYGFMVLWVQLPSKFIMLTEEDQKVVK